MVSSIDTREEKDLQKHKRPRKNAINKNHLLQNFEDESVAEIEIPCDVDDHYFKVKCIDLSKKQIANYCLQV